MASPSLSLTDLNHDVLSLICQAVAERDLNYPVSVRGPKPVDGLSKTNKMLRELCLPSLFETITIRNDWVRARHYVEKLAETSNIVRYMRSAKVRPL